MKINKSKLKLFILTLALPLSSASFASEKKCYFFRSDTRLFDTDFIWKNGTVLRHNDSRAKREMFAEFGDKKTGTYCVFSARPFLDSNSLDHSRLASEKPSQIDPKVGYSQVNALLTNPYLQLAWQEGYSRGGRSTELVIKIPSEYNRQRLSCFRHNGYVPRIVRRIPNMNEVKEALGNFLMVAKCR